MFCLVLQGEIKNDRPEINGIKLLKIYPALPQRRLRFPIIKFGMFAT